MLIDSSIANNFVELKGASIEMPQVAAAVVAAFDVEKKLQEQLNLLKADLLSTQDLQDQMVRLRESKAAVDERCDSKDLQISELQFQLGSLRAVEMELNKKITHMEQQCAKRAAPNEEVTNKLQQDLNEAQSRFRSAEDYGTALLADLENLRVTVKARDDEVSALASQKAELEKKVRSHPHLY